MEITEAILSMVNAASEPGQPEALTKKDGLEKRTDRKRNPVLSACCSFYCYCSVKRGIIKQGYLLVGVKSKNSFELAVFVVLFLSLFLTLSITANNALFVQTSTPPSIATINPNQGQAQKILPQQATTSPVDSNIVGERLKI